MDDVITGKVRVQRTTTWGNPPTVRTPRFVRMFAGLLRLTKHIVVGFIIFEVALVVGLVLYLTYGTTFSRVYASDGSSRSCEIHFLSRGNR
jgi:hypothetical protein